MESRERNVAFPLIADSRKGGNSERIPDFRRRAQTVAITKNLPEVPSAKSADGRSTGVSIAKVSHNQTVIVSEDIIPMTSTPNLLGNKILARLPKPDLERIRSLLERVAPDISTVVGFPDKEPKWVHFPLSGVLSSMVVLEDGSTVEASTIGNEGMDGLYLMANPVGNPYRINVQVSGELLRMSVGDFRLMLRESPTLSQLLLRYAMVLIQRGAQNGACIQHHTIEERMCRWLLETALRKGQDRFPLTQSFLSDILGVRRQSINLTARILQQANLIKYSRGELTIIDRAGLEEASCECFRVTTQMYDRMMALP